MGKLCFSLYACRAQAEKEEDGEGREGKIKTKWNGM